MMPKGATGVGGGKSQETTRNTQYDPTFVSESSKIDKLAPSNYDPRYYPLPTHQHSSRHFYGVQTPQKPRYTHLKGPKRASPSSQYHLRSGKPVSYTESPALLDISDGFKVQHNSVISPRKLLVQYNEFRAAQAAPPSIGGGEREQELGSNNHAAMPVIDLDSEPEDVNRYSIDDSSSSNDDLRSSILYPLTIRPVLRTSSQKPPPSAPPKMSQRKSTPTQHVQQAKEVHQETRVTPLQSRRRERQSASDRYSALAASRESTFSEQSLFDHRSFHPTPATTAQNSFASQYEDKSNPNAYVEYEEVATDFDEDPPEPVVSVTKIASLNGNTKQSGARDPEALARILQKERELDVSFEILQQDEACYEPGSDEEELLALQREFEESAPTTIFRPLPDIEPEIRDGSEDEFDIDDDTAKVLSMLVCDDDHDDDCTEDSSSQSPSQPFNRFPYFIQYEITRLALDMGLSLEECRTDLPNIISEHGAAILNASTRDTFVEAFDQLKSVFATRTGNTGSESTKIGDNIWMATKNSRRWPENMQLSGRLEYSDRNGFDMDIRLNPLSISQGHRFSYRFGGDRFLTLKLPSVSAYSANGPALPAKLRKLGADEIRKRLTLWLRTTRLDILNRTWTCFFIRDGSESINVKGVKQTSKFIRAFFFAEEGVGLGECSLLRQRELGLEHANAEEEQPRFSGKMSREDLINWHMPVDKIMADIEAEADHKKRAGMFAKAWSRISLSLSTTRPTVTFKPDQIKYVNDTISSPTSPILEPVVMDDGCCICSPEAMRQIRDKLGLDETPSAVQGRLGGAKGMWFIDPNADWSCKDVWIQIRRSQLKYLPHDSDLHGSKPDWARLTLFVLKLPKETTAANLNSQLVPILTERKVPASVFEELLNEDLEQDLDQLLEAALGRIDLRRWLNGPGGMSRERDGSGEIREFESGLPRSELETIAFLIDAGFEPTNCYYLVELLAGVVESQCNSVTDRTHISVPQSTVVFCIADPTGTLEPGTISLNLAGFMDTREQTKITMLEGEVLVARNPAHLPSDIQKVTAVCPSHSGLRRLQNVAVFSTKGDYPLAGLLSGGDYDGDQVWLTWDPRIVEPFQNSKNNYLRFNADEWFFRPALSPADLDPDTSQPGFFDQFFEQGFAVAMIDDRTGYCTTILERYIYAQRRNIRFDNNAVFCGKLCGIFVDAVKQGHIPEPKTLERLKKLGRKFSIPPLYKSPKEKEYPPGKKEDWFILDYLVFHVAKMKADEKKKEFDKMRIESNMDRHLLAYYRKMLVFAEDQAHMGNPHPLRAIQDLEKKLREIKKLWGGSMNDPRAVDFRHRLEIIYNQYRALHPSKEELVDSCVASWALEQDAAGSLWSKLRASMLFSICASGTSKLPWWMAAWELALLKALELRSNTNVQAPRVVAVDMYTALKPTKQVRRLPEPSLYLSDAGTRTLT